MLASPCFLTGDDDRFDQAHLLQYATIETRDGRAKQRNDGDEKEEKASVSTYINA